jgi:exosortase
MSSIQPEAVLVGQGIAKRSRVALVALSAAGALLIVLLYASTIMRLVAQWWDDPNFSHGFFVPLFAGYLAWSARDRLAQIKAKPSWSGLLVLVLGLSLFIVGRLGSELFLARTSLMFVIAGAIVFLRGWETFRTLSFAWIVLFLMVPLPMVVFNQLTLKLQFLASGLGSSLLAFCGVPVLRQGNIITLPAMPLEVAEACSGIRSLLSLTTLTIIYGYFADKRIWMRIALLCAAVPIAIAANAVRLLGTGLTVQYWDPEKGSGFFHEFSGWVIFIVSVAMLMGVHALLNLIASREVKHAA